MLTVNADPDVVERQLGGGELACPSCGGVLARWGHGAKRRVRLLGANEITARTSAGVLVAPDRPLEPVASFGGNTLAVPAVATTGFTAHPKASTASWDRWSTLSQGSVPPTVI